MTQIVLTRHYSGFRNVADYFSVGNNEAASTSVARYDLPAGYSIDGDVVRDSAGYECAIYPDRTTGRPQIYSLAGPISASPILAPAE